MDKNMRAGFQGKKDAMRELADKLMNHPGTAKDVYMSASAADKEKIRPFKKGGHVKKEEYGHGGHVKKSSKSGSSCKTKTAKSNYAAGGVAKIRHKQATKSGAPLPASKQKRGCKNK
jgi:hypothetical protein